MQKKNCCVVPEPLILHNTRLKKAAAKQPITGCQFSDILNEIYEYKGNDYCILHLPSSSIKNKELHSRITTALEKCASYNIVNFDYVYISQQKIKLTLGQTYSFAGTHLTNIELTGSRPKSVNFSYSRLENLSVVLLYTDRFELRNCLIISNFHFINSETQCLFAGHNFIKIKSKEKVRFNDLNFKFYLSGTIETIILLRNNFYIPLKIESQNIKELRFPLNNFFSCPALFRNNINNIPILNLPSKKSFRLAFLKSLPKNSIIEEYLGEDLWDDQYKKFREIYNIAKERNMYTEQSDYFSLMQYCLKKSKHRSCLLKLSGSIYHIISDYGQDISRPFAILVFSFLIFSGIFYLLGINISNAFYLSLTQTIRPYSIFYDQDVKAIIYNSDVDRNKSTPPPKIIIPKEDNYPRQDPYLLTDIHNSWIFIISSLLESTVSLTLLACFLLALRWNFRKA